MNLELLERRQAVTEWRDRFVLSAWALVNGAAKGAREGFEKHLEDAGFIDSIWDRPSFTYDRIDAAMRATVTGGIQGLLAAAADELKQIDPAYEPLAVALASSAEAVILPMIKLQATGEGPAKDAAPSEPAAQGNAGVLTRMSGYISELGVTRNAREWGGWAADVVTVAASAASRTVQNRTGLHDLLRRTAIDRIATAWMGGRTDSRSVVTQLVALIDETGQGARSASL
ncbi:hypothetical protein I5E68_15630 [Novosphingobium sp. YJ-S2-02]|uniref:Uncharacterized protein n=1 Tax=Novosphingobium aureum TaxID=2792964 RepID=A0A931HDZ8_9SPHN|nr:hypothetical protein [Novosphingobium aureum]MBH0114375.1 hypothetical protein [Novosphingobium aureum]